MASGVASSLIGPSAAERSAAVVWWPAPRGPSLAVIVPATDRPPTLDGCVRAIEPALAPGDEMIVVTEADGEGPAAARNAGGLRASADVLVFIDSDVFVHPDALERLRETFAAEPALTAVFGSYDDRPAVPGLVSQFRNLLHHHLHQRHPGAAGTFWSGLGAVRRAAFLAVGGFDTERFVVPAVEDIDLGMRLLAMGGRIDLDPRVQGTHHKRWTLTSMIQTDFHRRGVPWALMCIERRRLPQTLNLSWRERASTTTMLVAINSAARRRWRHAVAAVGLLAWLDAPFYALLYRRTGLVRTAVGVVLHVLHRLVGVAALPGSCAEYLRQPRG